MLLLLLLLFTVLPAAELYLLLRIGALLGPLNTVTLILVTGLVGAWLAKREGLHVLRQLTEDLRSGLPPATRIAEGALVVVGGLLLVTPGVLTDITGFAFIFPLTRRLIAPVFLRALASRFIVGSYRAEEGPIRERDYVPPVQGIADEGIPKQGEQRPNARRSPFDHPVS